MFKSVKNDISKENIEEERLINIENYEVLKYKEENKGWSKIWWIIARNKQNYESNK